MLIVLWAGWLQVIKISPDGRESLGMENRYAEGRQRMFQKPRGHPHTGLGQTQGPWRQQAGGSWEQNPVLDQQLVLLEVAKEGWFLAGLMWLSSPRSQPSEIPCSLVPYTWSMLSLDATWLAPLSKLERTVTSSKQPSLFTLI